MEASRISTDQQWTMKEAAKQVGVGLPRLYGRLREKGLFSRLGSDGRHVPLRRLQQEGLFHVHNSAFRKNGAWIPCPKVKVTFDGLMLLQEIADELEREKQEQKSSGERSGLPGGSDGHQRESAVVRDSTEPRSAGGSRPQISGN